MNLNKLKLLIIFISIGALSGCSYDPIIAQPAPKPIIVKAAPKPIPKTKDDKITLAMYKGVVVKARKNTIYWDVFYINENSEPKCIVTSWKYYDLVPKMPRTWVYVEQYTSAYVGYFKEQPFEVDNIHVFVGGSAKINKFSVLDPHNGRNDCTVPAKIKAPVIIKHVAPPEKPVIPVEDPDDYDTDEDYTDEYAGEDEDEPVEVVKPVVPKKEKVTQKPDENSNEDSDGESDEDGEDININMAREALDVIAREKAEEDQQVEIPSGF